MASKGISEQRELPHLGLVQRNFLNIRGAIHTPDYPGGLSGLYESTLPHLISILCGTGNACSPSDLFAAINFFASACMRLESAPFK